MDKQGKENIQEDMSDWNAVTGQVTGSTEKAAQMDQMAVALKKLRISAVFKALMILLGAFVVQFAASMLCLIVLAVYVMVVQGGDRDALVRTLMHSIDDYSMVISLVYAGIAILWCGSLYFRWQWREKPFPYRKALGGRRIPEVLALGFGSCIILTMIVGLAAQAFPKAFEHYQELMETLNIYSSILAAPYVMLLGPVAEEFIFRGVILDRLKPAFSFWIANVIQAVLFGVFHMNIIQGLYAFALGMLLGMVVQVTGTILISMIMHITFNSTSVVLSLLSTYAPEVYNRAFVLIVIAAIVYFVTGLRYYTGQNRKRDRA